MPRNFKEAIFFTLPMCSMMALGDVHLESLSTMPCIFRKFSCRLSTCFYNCSSIRCPFSRTLGQRAVLPLFERLSQALAKDCGHIWRYGAHDGIIDVSLWPAF